ncbi:MAG: ArsA-related P-loop ATPase [Acidimicrobiales bacterium]|nr:ArsA-related P-loop ATPase [Acidimicrobiales bacterium]
MSTLTTTVADHDVIICAGSGGVGKTTTAAALALAGARDGRRVVVVTIDPARRLADAFGLGATGLDNAPRHIPGPWEGELWAAMLDTSATFDGLVTRYATDEQAARILANPFYRNMADALSGTQEYMAAEKLHELAADERFDLVVIDTPPTRNALDFIDAPTTLTRFLDHRLYRMLMAPTRRMTRAVGLATSAFVRTMSRVVGTAVVEDAIEFFQAFEGLEEGFRDRAHEVADRFRSPDTAFVLITSPRPDALEEARWFAARLRDDDIAIKGIVVNRVEPRPVTDGTDRFRSIADQHPGTALAALCDTLVDQCDAADAERQRLGQLLGTLGELDVVLVPMLGGDVRDLDGLTQIADALVPVKPA